MACAGARLRDVGGSSNATSNQQTSTLGERASKYSFRKTRGVYDRLFLYARNSRIDHKTVDNIEPIALRRTIRVHCERRRCRSTRTANGLTGKGPYWFSLMRSARIPFNLNL